MEIPELKIQLGDVNIRDLRSIEVPEWMAQPSYAIPVAPPVTTQVGVPIVNMPGCVEAHVDSKENQSLKDEDKDGVRTFCDAGTPSFSPIDYDANRLKLEQEAPPPPAIRPPKKAEPPKPPASPEVPKTEAPLPECPSRAQELKDPVGKIVEGNKKIVAYETVGKECLPVFEKLSIPDQIVQNIPSAGMVTTTASIAIVATSSALLAKPLADLLLKVVKPTVKKVIGAVKKKLGKEDKKLSLFERQMAQRDRNRAIRELRKTLKK